MERRIQIGELREMKQKREKHTLYYEWPQSHTKELNLFCIEIGGILTNQR
jgi:hypothetical protein